jgi:hypothetical protein
LRDKAFSPFACGSFVECFDCEAQRRRKAKDELSPSFETSSIREPALGYHVANENRRRTDSSAA